MYGAYNAGGTLHILKTNTGTWCGRIAFATTRTEGKVCRACQHNQEANAAREAAWSGRNGR